MESYREIEHKKQCTISYNMMHMQQCRDAGQPITNQAG